MYRQRLSVSLAPEMLMVQNILLSVILILDDSKYLWMVSKYEVVSKPSGPGSCQDVLTEKGGLFKDGGDWQANVCVAGNLFTGQNPQSAGPLAEAMVAARG